MTARVAPNWGATTRGAAEAGWPPEARQGGESREARDLVGERVLVLGIG